MSTVPELAWKRAAAAPNQVALRFHELGVWRPITWSSLTAEAASIAGGLRAKGLQKGDVVGLVMANHPAWVSSFLGIQAAGGVVAAVDPDLDAQQVASSLAHSGAIGVICGDQEQFDKVDEQQADGQAPGVKFLVVNDTRGIRSLDAPDRPDADRVLTLAQLQQQGTSSFVLDPVDATAPAVWQDGAVLTHADELGTANLVAQALQLGAKDQLLAQATFAQRVERSISLIGMIQHGLAVAIGEGGQLAPAELHAVQPTVFNAAPGYLDRTGTLIARRIETARGLRKFALGRGWRPRQPASVVRRPSPVSPLLASTLVVLALIAIWFAATSAKADPMRIVVALAIALVAAVGLIVHGSAVVTPLRRQLGLTRVRAVVGTPGEPGLSLLGALGVPLVHPDTITGVDR